MCKHCQAYLVVQLEDCHSKDVVIQTKLGNHYKYQAEFLSTLEYPCYEK